MIISRRLGRASRVTFTAVCMDGKPEVGYLCFFAYKKATTIEPSPMRSPGTYPAINSVEIDTPPATVEYTINALVGGIRRPVGAEAILAAVAKAGS